MITYSVGEFARLLNVHPNTLRRWDKEGKLKPVGRSLGNQRVYSEEQVKEYFKRQGIIKEEVN